MGEFEDVLGSHQNPDSYNRESVKVKRATVPEDFTQIAAVHLRTKKETVMEAEEQREF